MMRQIIGLGFGGSRLILFGVAAAMIALAAGPAFGITPLGLPGDYNHDGIVSHADYSVLGNTIGSTTDLRADGDGNGVVDHQDFDIYAAHYGETASQPSVLPLVVTPSVVSGNVEWTFTYSGVSGALAGHLNILTDGPQVLSVIGGSSFLDDGVNPVGVPGKKTGGGIVSGISLGFNSAFAALGTTLGVPHGTTLEFMRLTTAGHGPTILSYTGEYGYQGIDYTVGGTAQYIPEPGTLGLACAALGLGLGCRARRRKRWVA
jgi:PEP-CTERM motif